MPKLQRLQEAIRNALGPWVASLEERLGEVTLVVKAADYLSASRTLRDHPDLRFEEAVDLCGVDYSTYGDVGAGSGPRPGRFAAVSHLLSISRNWRLRLRCFCPDDAFPLLPSLVEIWPSVNWYEREAFDLFGIVVDGHPDLRRILMPEDWEGYPLRKDYPVQIKEPVKTYEPLQVSQEEFVANVEATRERARRD